MNGMIPWYSQKTTWAAVLTIVTGVFGFSTDFLTPEQTAAIMTLFGGVTAIFGRQGIEKSKVGGVEPKKKKKTKAELENEKRFIALYKVIQKMNQELSTEIEQLKIEPVPDRKESKEEMFSRLVEEKSKELLKELN